MSLFAIGIILILSGLVFYRYEFISTFISFLICIYLTALTYFSINISDNISYTILYNNSVVNSSGVAAVTSNNWVKLCQWGLLHNLTYQQFKTILFCLCILSLFFVVKVWIGKYMSLIFSLFVIYPVLLEIIQIRFFVAEMLCLIALVLLEKNKKWSIPAFVILLILGASIHNSVIIYAIFLLIPLVKKYKKKLIALIIIFDALSLALGSKLKLLITNFVTDKQVSYLDNGRNGISLILLIILISLLSLTCYIIGKSIVAQEKVNNRYKRTAEFLVDANICILLLISLLPLAFNFYRLLRISWVLFYILVGIAIRCKVNTIEKVKINIVVIAIIFSIIGFVFILFHLTPNAFTSYNFIG